MIILSPVNRISLASSMTMNFERMGSSIRCQNAEYVFFLSSGPLNWVFVIFALFSGIRVELKP
jgi:hypothetical protein